MKKILVSGGVGDSGYNEALVMRDMAVEAGVPSRRHRGLERREHRGDGARLCPVLRGGERAVLAVSQFYHLPRIKLAYQRAGWDVLTSPARTSTPIKQTPYLVAREVPAFWVYYLRALFG